MITKNNICEATCSLFPQGLFSYKKKGLLKGQSPLLSHALVVMFSIMLVLVAVTAMNSIRNDYQDFVGTIEAQQVCGIIKGSIEKIYQPTDYAVQINQTYGKVVLDLPERIADSRYRVKLFNDSIRVEMLGSQINETCRTGFNITMSGTASGGKTAIIFDILKGGASNDYRITMQRA